MTTTLLDAFGFGAHIYLLDPAGLVNANCVLAPASWHPSERGLGNVVNAGTIWPYTRPAAIGSDWATQAINVLFDDITTDTIYVFLSCMTPATTGFVTCWSLTVDNGAIKLYDANGALVGTVATGIATDTCYRVTIKWMMADSSAVRVWWSASGNYHTTAPQLESTGDFLPAKATGTNVRLSLIAGGNQSFIIPMYYGAGTVRSDDGAAIGTNDTRQTPVFCASYTSGIATPTPDTGNALDHGNWDDAEELPEGATAVDYSITTTNKEGIVTTNPNGAAVPGPADDPDLASCTLLWAFWVWRWKARQDGAFAKFPDFKAWYGTTSSTAYGSVQTGNSAYQTTVTTQAVGGAQFPALTDHMKIGFATAGAWTVGDLVYVQDMWAGVVVEYAAPPAGRRVCVDGLVTTWP